MKVHINNNISYKYLNVYYKRLILAGAKVPQYCIKKTKTLQSSQQTTSDISNFHNKYKEYYSILSINYILNYWMLIMNTIAQ